MKHRVLITLALILVTVAPILNGCGGASNNTARNIQKVGFDLDDTLVYSTPAFEHAFSRDVRPFSEDFWAVVNSSDSQYSCVKPETVDLLERHRRKGREIYVITAREPHSARVARKFVASEFGIPEDHVYFEPNGKTNRLKQLGIDLYYGDSDSDINDSRAAGIKAVRIQRNPKSSYDEKYTPGKFGEKVLDNTTGHRCSK